MKNKIWIWVLTIALFGTLLFVPSINFEYTLDDELYAEKNRVTTKGLENWTELFQYGSMNFLEIGATNTGTYRPFTLLTFAVENELEGKFNPKVSHTINLILYFGLLLVLGFLLAGLAARRNLPWWFPALVLLLFVVHPLHVEVVASAKSRDTLLTSLLAFSSILIWWKFQPNLKLVHWIPIVFLYFLSLVSKEESIPLIAVVGLISYFFLGKKPLDSVKSVLPFLGTAAIYLAIRSLVLDSGSSAYESYVNSVLYIANGSDRIATNFFIYLQYIKLLFFPHPLSWDYSFSQLIVQNFSNLWVWVSIFFFAALIWLAIRGLKDRSLLSFGLIFYFATFSIFANLVPSLTIGSNMGERFLFIPSLAFAFLMVFVLWKLGEKLWPKKNFLFPILILAPVLVGFTWKTIDRTQVWKNSLTLTKTDVINAPRSWRTHTFYAINLGAIAKDLKSENPDSSQNLFLEAKLEYEKAFDILGPNIPVSQYLNNYAEVLIYLGDTVQAVSILEESARKNPKAFYSLFQLGRIAYEKGDYDKAENTYLQALNSERPDFAPLYRNLGITFQRKSEKEKAIAAFEKSLEYWDAPEVRRVLGFLYSETGNIQKASEFLSTSAESNPDEIVFINSVLKGNEAFSKNNFQAALVEYQKIEQIFDQVDGISKFPSFYAAYGKSLLASGDTAKSKRYFLLAINEIDSLDPVVYTNLGTIAFMKDKNFAEAEKYYKKAVELSSTDQFDAYSNLGMAQLALRKEEMAASSFEKALQFGSNRAIIANLYLINKSIGNQDKMNFYANRLNQK
ncbi:tetratricopeptide repeat protein [Algoriphagus sp.]|uniref:tetratricopeptide repeat protein n=1 Tax=Algoriphagus sp. TaxID=1872435 RepID=UPI00391D0292